MRSKMDITEEHIWYIFKKFDTDNSGYISQENLTHVMNKLGKKFTPEEVEEMIREVDLA